MAFIEWSDSFSVNVEEIDRQHRYLINMINELNEAMMAGQGKAIIGKTIQDLTFYTAEHFETEEKYFDLFSYPATVQHKKEHAAFVRQVLEFKEGYENGRIALSIDIMNFLRDWLKNHILGSDMRYSGFLNAKGLH